MHEVSIANNIFKIVREELRKNSENEADLKRVKLNIGRLTAVVPEALEFAWNAITQDTPFEGTNLAISEIPVIIKCHECNKESTLETPVFICSHCGSRKTELVSGDELDIISLVID